MKLFGTVQWFNDAKGYGWLHEQDSDVEIFVHYTAIEHEGFKTLFAGQHVMFNLITGPKGPQAANVMKTGTKDILSNLDESTLD